MHASLVPFGRGNRKTLGFVCDTARPPGQRNLKAVAEVIDPASQLDANLWKLGDWISRYYLAPDGHGTFGDGPIGGGKIRPEDGDLSRNSFARRRIGPNRRGARQRRILDELLEARNQGVEPVSAEQLISHSGGSRDTIRRLAQRGLIRTESRPQVLEQLAESIEPDPFELNEDQHKAFEVVKSRLGCGFSTTLLHGGDIVGQDGGVPSGDS